jgi:hypothetical protein
VLATSKARKSIVPPKITQNEGDARESELNKIQLLIL